MFGNWSLYVAVAADHPLVAKGELFVADLLGYSFVVYKQVAMTHFLRSLLQYLRRVGVHDVRFTQDNDVCAFVNTIVDGRGFALLSDDEENPIRKVFAGDRSVRILPVVDLDFPVVTVEAWSRDRAGRIPCIRAASDAISKMKGCAATRRRVPCESGGLQLCVQGRGPAGQPSVPYPAGLRCA